MGRGLAVQDGTAAVLDQFLFAGSSSVLVLLLGRGLTANEYGAFVLAYSLILLLAQVQTALMAEPMSVFGPTRFKEQEAAYVRAVEGLNFRTGLVAAAVMAAIAAAMWAFGRQPMASAFLGAGLAVPSLLGAWLRRRALYLQGRIWRSVLASSLFMVSGVGGVYGLYRLGVLNALTGMVVLGAASIVALLASPLPRPQDEARPSGILHAHWQYGQWALLTVLLGWCGNLYYFLLPIWHGLDSAAALRALMNFIYPVIQVNQALGLFFLPRWAAFGSQDGFARSLFRVTRNWILLCLVLCTGVFLFGPPVMRWAYGGRYDAVASLLPWAFLLVIPDGISYVIGNGLRASRRPDRVAAATIPLPIVAVFPGCLFMYLWGPVGAVAALLIASALQLGLNWHGWKHLDAKQASPT